MIDFEFEFQYAEEKQPTLQKSAAASSRTLCGALRRQRLRKVHTATVHQRINPPVLRGELKGFCRLNGRTPRNTYRRDRRVAASVFQDPRSQFFTVNSSNEVAFGLENHGLPQDNIRRRVDEAFRIFHLERPEGSQCLRVVQRRATAHLHLVRVGNGHRYFSAG